MRFRSFLTVLLLVLLCTAAANGEVTITMLDEDGTASLAQNQPVSPASGNARAAFIDDIVALAEREYDHTGGRAQEAQYSSSIFICKNFTVYLFRQTAGKYRMAEYPGVKLVIPDNLPKEKCKEFSYGIVWKDVSPEEGNPFEVAAQFIYDASLSKEENKANAREFMKNVQRGDYFQMSANYYYGVGAHSLVFISDYDPQTGKVHWTDSNMKGEKRKGIRYAWVQFDAEKEIDWFVDAFCHKGRGATLYRLRQDIVFAE